MFALKHQETGHVALVLVGREQIVEMQTERGDEPEQLHVPRVDELPAVLGHLAVGERAR
jgi:hypothetical protein